jgi:DNA-binding CsgD family transcriptional regulator
MKKYHPKNRPESKKHSKQNLNAGKDIDDMADQLVELSQKLLPNGALQGVIQGLEKDIRQDAVMMALGWYLRDVVRDGSMEHCCPWHAPRAIAGALRIAKRDTIKAVKGHLEALEGMPIEDRRSPVHPAHALTRDWPTDVLRGLTHTAIRIALRTGQITAANAAVAQEILVDGTTVMEVAVRLGVHRSTIYQHLSRVRRKIPAIIETIEVPLELLK